MKKGSGSVYGYFFLFSDILVYSKQKQKKFKLKAVIQIKGLIIEDIPDTKVTKNSFKIVGNMKEPMFASTNTPSEKANWLLLLRKTIAECKN